MAINKHDDYEALAKLLYPSIEASGNVYYGQTRKLTLDEVLKRNSLGFDSHIESFYNESGSRYDGYFCWRLGSLHGSIRVDRGHIGDGIIAGDFDVPFVKRILYADSEEIIYDDKLIYTSDKDEFYTSTSIVPIFGTIFAKYRLDKRSTEITNELNSGSYESYEVDVEPVLDGIYVTDDFNPVNSIDDDISDRHFYISKENGTDYLYIQILTNEDTGKILTFTALEDSEISLSMAQRTNVPLRVVFYRVSQDDGSFTDNWESYHYDWEVTPSGPISLNTGRKIQFKSDITNIGPMPNNADDCLKFVINSGTLFVSGSCISMCHPDTDESMIDTLDDYALYGLFSNIKNMYGTPVLPNVSKLGSGCYDSMFKNCTSLTVAPKIKSSDTYSHISHISENDNYCYYNMFSGCVSLVSPPNVIGYYETDQYYHSGIGTCDSMFKGCTSLKTSPVIRYRTLDSSCCYNMFYGCSSLKVIRCGAKYIESSATKSWTHGVSTNGVFIKSTANYSSGPDGIPDGWTVVTKDDDYFAVHKEPDNGFRIDKHTPSDNYKNDYLVTSGTDSSTNGRGFIANTISTIGKMERSFDENNTHPMNTYNADGSFNQEIWGYKSFNSPVKFRNGIYSDGASVLSVLPDFDVNILAYSVEDTSSGTMTHVSEINAIDYDLTIKFTGNARYSQVYATMSDTPVCTSIAKNDKHIARFFSVDSTNIHFDIQSYMAGESTIHYANNTVECGFVYSELTVPGKASVYAKEKPSINITTDGDIITESDVSSTVEAGIRVNEGIIQIEAKEGKPCNIIISTGNGDMDMIIEMYHFDKDPTAGQEYDTSSVTIRLGNKIQGGTKEGIALINMMKRTLDISTESRVFMGILDENGSTDNSCIEINRSSSVGTSARIKADHVYIDGNVQVNGSPINNA